MSTKAPLLPVDSSKVDTKLWATVNKPDQIKTAYKKRRARCITLVVASLSVVPQKIISLITFIISADNGGGFSDTRSINYLVFIGLGLFFCFLQAVLLLHHEILLGWLKTKDLSTLMKVHKKHTKREKKKKTKVKAKKEEANKTRNSEKSKKKGKKGKQPEKGADDGEFDEEYAAEVKTAKDVPKSKARGCCDLQFWCCWTCCCKHHEDPLLDVVAIDKDYVDKDNLRYKHIMYRTLFWVQLGLMTVYQILFTVSDSIIANTAGSA